MSTDQVSVFADQDDQLRAAIYGGDHHRVVIVIADDGEQVSTSGFIRPFPAPAEPRPAFLIGAYIANNMEKIVEDTLAWAYGKKPGAAANEPPQPPEETIPMIEAKAALLETIEREAS